MLARVKRSVCDAGHKTKALKFCSLVARAVQRFNPAVRDDGLDSEAQFEILTPQSGNGVRRGRQSSHLPCHRAPQNATTQSWRVHWYNWQSSFQHVLPDAFVRREHRRRQACLLADRRPDSPPSPERTRGKPARTAQDRPVRGTAKGSFVLALMKLKPYLPSGFVPASDRAIASAYERALNIWRESEAIRRWMSTAQRTASTALLNSANSPSPVFLTTRPRCSAIFGFTREDRCSLSWTCVPSSSKPVKRLYPATSAARMAVSRRSSSLSDWGLISMCQQFCCGSSG
jgi:hypothetical protein